MQEQVLKAIKDNKLIKSGEVIGVAVSGGMDSISLLHFLNENKEKLDCDIVAITVDHCLRENSLGDSMFVARWCRENRIYCHKFTVDAGKIAREKNIGLEQAAREARYGVFDSLIKKGIVDKIALAHHQGDQAETILLHILRGCGLAGARGMEYQRGEYIRPFLNVTKDDIVRYASLNCLEHVEDETNSDTAFNRNYIRNVIMPQLRKRWEGVDQNIVTFGAVCKQDDDYIFSQADFGALIEGHNLVKIPLLYFMYNESLVNRIIMKVFNKLNVYTDIERKHLVLVRELAKAENGKKINLPYEMVAFKEYEYITICRVEKRVIAGKYPFKVGNTNFCDIYNINVKKTTDFSVKPNTLLIDADKLPKKTVFRTRENGDEFTKFGGGTKPLRAYLIDKKIPSRLRESLPVLALDGTVFCVAGVEISNLVKIDANTKSAYQITLTPLKQNKK